MMNCKGMFSFFLVIIFLFNLFSLNSSFDETEKEERKAENIALELEESSFYRNMLEVLADKVIERTVREEIAKGNTQPKEIKVKVNKELKKFFDSIEGKFSSEPKISFFLEKNFFSFNEEHLFEKVELKEEKLNELDKVAVFSLEGKMYLVEINFTGGLMKREAVIALIEFPSVSQVFLIPIDYTERVSALRVVP